MRRIVLRIRKREVFAFFLFFPFIEPYMMNQIPWLQLLYRAGKLLALGWILFRTARRLRSGCRVSRFVRMLFLFYVQLAVSTCLNGGSVARCIAHFLPVIFLAILLDSSSPGLRDRYCRGFSEAVLLWMLVNLVCVYVFPNGIYAGSTEHETYYLLGHNNNLIRIALPGIAFAGAYDCGRYGKPGAHTFLLLSVTTLTVFRTDSKSAMIACVFLVAHFVLFRNRRPRQSCYAGFWLLLMLAAFVYLVQYGHAEEALGRIADWLGKEKTLSGRTEIWQAGIGVIREAPVWGYGFGAPIPEIEEWHYYPSSYHNYFLDLAFRAGIPHVFVQIWMLAAVCRRLDKAQTRRKHFLTACLMACFLLWQVLPFTHADARMIQLLLLLCYVSGESDGKDARPVRTTRRSRA